MKFGHVIDWARPGKAAVLVGGQFGSEGKGLAASWLAMNSNYEEFDYATTNAGAQAGHTTRFRDGSGFVCFHMPTTGVIHSVRDCISYINAGSIIEPASLAKELEDCNVDPRSIVIHPRAAVITDANRSAERDPSSSTAKLASTQKGVGHAIADKIMRRSKLAGECDELSSYNIASIDLNKSLQRGVSVVVEVPQGFDLSLNHGLAYPYTTSRDCWVGSGLSDAGIHPSFLGKVAMVVRAFPIRVGDLYNELGEKIGESGPFYGDSQELDWARDFPGVEPERTTVTKRVRRIATWSNDQYERSLFLNRPDILFLNFLNYLPSSQAFLWLIKRMQESEIRVGVFPSRVYSFGPCPEDVVTSFDAAMAWYENRRF